MTIQPEVKQELIERALKIRERAYAPYSSYKVGASLITSTGEFFDGVNVENAAYPMTICGERNAIFQAVTHGFREFQAIAVASDNGGAPCGSCRQVLSEFDPGMAVITVDSRGDVVLETTVRELLPEAFGPEDLASR
jgi:cytidine deaminase